MGSYSDFEWKPYVPVAERRRKAAREMEKLKKKGYPISPVVIEGRTLARTFWGKAWNDNLERYSDFENRLPRGRTYVRNGSVVDLQIAPGRITARVSGSEMYNVTINIAAMSQPRWASLCADCAGAIDSLVELLQGRFSKGVMERICQQNAGLFPSPGKLQFSCNCADWASMCKHVAAALYGVGARLDEAPELLFKLRRVDEKELLKKASQDLSLSMKGPTAQKVLATDGLSDLFGLDLGTTDEEPAPQNPMDEKPMPELQMATAVPSKAKARAKQAKEVPPLTKAVTAKAKARAKAAPPEIPKTVARAKKGSAVPPKATLAAKKKPRG